MRGALGIFDPQFPQLCRDGPIIIFFPDLCRRIRLCSRDVAIIVGGRIVYGPVDNSNSNNNRGMKMSVCRMGKGDSKHDNHRGTRRGND